MEVKPAGDDAWLTAESTQVSRYWERYRFVLVTNTRDFVLLGEDSQGNPTKLETFRLAGSAADFETKLQHPRTFANSVGTALAEYLGRALSHWATLFEPRDLARLLASYARDGLARVEAAGDAPSLNAVRSALEEALGVRFEGERGVPSSARPWCRPSSTASSPLGCCGPGRLRLRREPSTGMKQFGIFVPQCCKRYSSRCQLPPSCSRSHSSADSGLPTEGWPEGSDTRSREGRSSTAGVHWSSGVQNSVGGELDRVLRASSLAQTSTATTTWAEGSTSWSGSS